MGFGLPASMGAVVACPQKTVISIVGDGGFMMALPELGTIASNGLPIKIVVMNNGTLGMVRQWQQLFFNKRYSQVEISSFPNAELLGAAFGIPARTVDKPADLDGALKEAFFEAGPYLLNVKVAPEECVYPMVPARRRRERDDSCAAAAGAGGRLDETEAKHDATTDFSARRKPAGALMRVAGVLTSRGYNIESLTVAKTLDPTLSSMTIVANVNEEGRALLIKQITRLVNVIKAVDLTVSHAVRRELALIKVYVSQDKRAGLLREAEIFRARAVDAAPNSYTLEVTGSPDKLDALISLLHNYGQVEMVRSGAMAMAREKQNKLPIPKFGEAVEEPVAEMVES